MKLVKKTMTLVAIFFVAQSSLCLSGTIDSEREALARIINELNLIDQMAVDAEKDKPHSPQYQFKYDSLQLDIRSIVKGIQDHLSRPVRMPKPVAPLIQEYSK